MTNNAAEFLKQVAILLPTLRATERKLDREIARQFNAFSLFNTNENASSRVLAFLLDPQETHGQGTAFLCVFVRKFFPEWQKLPLGNVNVLVEYSTEESRRIDVYLKIGDHHIGIENKFRGASDQRNQVLDYLKELEKKAKEKENKFSLIYLGTKGEKPSYESYPQLERGRYKDHFILGSWIPFSHEEDTPAGDILSWLEECIKDCQADNVRWFLKQFASYVRNEILGKREADMTNETIINLALKDDNLEAALRIADCREELIAVAVRIRYGDRLAVCGLLGWARIEPEREPL